jgi:DNA-binding CsgD family transcriptional regulator
MAQKTADLERDLQTMLRIVARPDHADAADPLPWSVMTALQELIVCDCASLTMFDTDRRELVIDLEVGEPVQLAEGDLEQLDEAFWTHYWNSPPCHYPDLSGDLTSVTTASDFYSDRELHSAAMYCEWFRPMGVEREMMLCLPSQPGRVLRLLFFRGPGPDFSQRDRGLLTLLRPHLYDAYREWQHRQRNTPQLTTRQWQLLRLVAAGYTNRQIARRLSITEATVRKHLEHVFQRLQVTSRTAAVTRAFGGEQPVDLASVDRARQTVTWDCSGA